MIILERDVKIKVNKEHFIGIASFEEPRTTSNVRSMVYETKYTWH
jgi:hypothetical protein